METKLLFLDITDAELLRAFKVVCPDGDFIMHNDTYGEVLQYMGTVIKPDGSIRHEFRHRALPSNNERKYWSIICSNEFLNRFRTSEELQAQCF